ncbi:MAG: hypothetical protein FH756_09915 [Firmicutes bacterium]|nr:hypothetical protein [Bacillota bacterium]
MAVGFSFYFFVNQSSITATEQSELQFNVRLAKEKVKGIVRFADSMEIYEDGAGVEELCGDGDEAIYTENGSVIYYEDGTTTTLLQGNDNINYEITFNVVDKFFLCYNIKGAMDGKTFQMSSEIQILNINHDDEIIKDFGDSSTTGTAIVFQITESTI